MRMKLFTLCSLFSALMVANAIAQNRFYLSQVANGRFDGGSFRTTFIMFNNSGSSGIVILHLTDDNGNPFSVNIAGLGSGSTFNFNLESGATRILQTDGSGNRKSKILSTRQEKAKYYLRRAPEDDTGAQDAIVEASYDNGDATTRRSFLVRVGVSATVAALAATR